MSTTIFNAAALAEAQRIYAERLSLRAHPVMARISGAPLGRDMLTDDERAWMADYAAAVADEYNTAWADFEAITNLDGFGVNPEDFFVQMLRVAEDSNEPDQKAAWADRGVATE